MAARRSRVRASLRRSGPASEFHRHDASGSAGIERRRALRGEPTLDHVAALTDDVGIFQHAIYDVPNRTEGYCTDDVARAFIVAVTASRRPDEAERAIRLGRTYLSFLTHAACPDGAFRNFMSYDRTWLDEAGTPDSNGRALWALGHAMRFAPVDGWRAICAGLLERALPRAGDLFHMRSRAYAALGFAHAYESYDRANVAVERELRSIAKDFADRFTACAGDDWVWFENAMTYDNARLPEALLRIGTVLEDPDITALGLRTFDFYAAIVVEDDLFVPIGNDGWYERGKTRARYAQQPLEAASFVDAALAAEAATGDAGYRRLAETGLAWYRGANTRDAAMALGGGCCDGLEARAVNRNMGAESTLAYVASAFALAAPAAPRVVRLAR